MVRLPPPSSHSLTRSLARSLTRSLAHARTHARTHALAHSRRNFGKFLVDKEGAVAGRYAPDEDPLNLEPEITSLL